MTRGETRAQARTVLSAGSCATCDKILVHIFLHKILANNYCVRGHSPSKGSSDLIKKVRVNSFKPRRLTCNSQQKSDDSAIY